MRRRDFISALGGAAAWPLAGRAEQWEHLRRIGILASFEIDDTQGQALIKSFRAGLRAHGLIEGQNTSIIIRYAGTDIAQLLPLATELVQANVEVIVTHGTPPVQAALRASKTIPVVFATIGDPVGAGIVASLAKPSGYATGLSLIATDLAVKRLEILKETLPRLNRVGILWNPGNASLALQFKETEEAAGALGIQLQSLPAMTVSDFESSIRSAADTGCDAIISTSDTLQISQRAQIVASAMRYRLPVVGEFREIVMAGALLSYGPSRGEMWRRAAEYVDKILRGTMAGDIPVEQPTRFELLINVKTAKALGLDISPMLRARADEVIE
jgi:putative ABC transport system substrate-binding protein